MGSGGMDKIGSGCMDWISSGLTDQIGSGGIDWQLQHGLVVAAAAVVMAGRGGSRLLA